MGKQIAAVLSFAALLGAAPPAQTFTGIITEDMCGKEGHAAMKMGPPDSKCVIECVKTMHAKYALFDGNEVYILSDQKMPEKFAARKVTVTGTLDPATKTIKVDKIVAAK
jgi:hypothetical protein